jgi:flagellar operon protein
MTDPIAGGIRGSVGPAAPEPPRSRPGTRAGGGSFGEALEGALAGGPLHFSGHALQRLERRGIDVDAASLARLHGGVARAAAKGSRDSLVLVDDTAFVVSVRNRTVVTAVGREHMHDQVFTGIDSAVIA